MARPAKAMTDLTGTGGPDYFRSLNMMGWQKDWQSSTPLYGNQPHVVHLQSVNPVLMKGLKPGVSREEVMAAAKAFGEVRRGRGGGGGARRLFVSLARWKGDPPPPSLTPRTRSPLA